MRKRLYRLAQKNENSTEIRAEFRRKTLNLKKRKFSCLTYKNFFAFFIISLLFSSIFLRHFSDDFFAYFAHITTVVVTGKIVE